MPFRTFCTVSSLPFFTEFVGRVPFRLPLTNSKGPDIKGTGENALRLNLIIGASLSNCE